MIRSLRMLAASLALLAIPASAGTPKVGQVAPAFRLKMVDGTTVSSADLRGKVIVLNFWATWCGPCKAELPMLDSFYALRKENGLRVFAVTTEDSVPPSQLKKLFAVMHIPPVRSVRGPYDIMGAVPTNYVIDRSGHIRYAKAAAFDLDALNALLVPLLNEPAPPGTSAD